MSANWLVYYSPFLTVDFRVFNMNLLLFIVCYDPLDTVVSYLVF
jgi:hypothetical protein